LTRLQAAGSDQPDGQWIAVELPFGGLDAGDDRKHKRSRRDKDQERNADEDKAKNERDEGIQIDRDVEIERLLGMFGGYRRFLLLDEIDDERKQETNADHQGKVAENDPDLVVAGGNKPRN